MPETASGGHRISVALATHNGEQFVAEQVRSVLAQTQSVAEIVLSDDASQDDTVATVQAELESVATKVHSTPELVVLENQEPLGVSRNFEQAITACKSGLIALSDQDDVWREDKIARILEQLGRHPAALLVFTNARNVDAEGKPLGHTLFEALEMTRSERRKISQGRAFEVLLRRNLATGATVVFRRELFALASPFATDWLHDEWLAIIAAAQDRVAMIDDTLIDYRQHSANQIGQRKMTLAEKSQKFSESFSARCARLLRRAEQLEQFLNEAEGVPERYRQLALQKLVFEQARSGFPLNRFARIPHVFRHLINGNYRRFGTGLKDAVRNLLQPA